MASTLLNPPLPFLSEYNNIQWGFPEYINPRKPLLRTWDCRSGSQPDETKRMLSRSPRHRLDSFEARKESLAIHADYRRWEPTPFISFTASPTELRRIAERQAKAPGRGSQTITVINPNVRVKHQLPMINMWEEMHNYGVEDPYGRSYRYYENEYLCLWEVTAPEVVGEWEWDELCPNEQWYEDIILPAFWKHEHDENSGSVSVATFRNGALNLSSLWDALPSCQRACDDHWSDPCSLSQPDWDTSSEESAGQVQEDNYTSGADSEVEEVTIKDGMLKILA